MGVEPSADIERARIFEDVVVAPIPISNPTFGTGLAVVVMPFYHLGADSPLSNTIVAAGALSSGSVGVAAAQSTRLRGDQMRIDGSVGYADVRYSFYGTGSDAGSSGLSVPIVQRALFFTPELLFRAAGAAFFGVRYRGIRVDTEHGSMPGALPPAIAATLPGAISINSSGFGPRVVYDTRDHEQNPASGLFIDLRTNFADTAFGSDFSYQTWELGANAYRRTGPGVLALRGYACGASADAPLFDLCLFGAGNDLRGYEVGRYRDRAMIAGQGEYRFPLSGRLGAVVFAGWVKVARSFEDMNRSPGLPAAGVGLRWLASQRARVNLSVDIATGRDGTSAYVYVRESF